MSRSQPAGQPSECAQTEKQQACSKQNKIWNRKIKTNVKFSWRQNSYLLVTDSNLFEETLISAEIQFGRNMYTCVKISSNCHVRRWMNLYEKVFSRKNLAGFALKSWRERTKPKRMLKHHQHWNWIEKQKSNLLTNLSLNECRNMYTCAKISPNCHDFDE